MEQIEIIWLKMKLKEHKQWPPHMRIWKNICTYPHKSGIWYMRQLLFISLMF